MLHQILESAAASAADFFMPAIDRFPEPRILSTINLLKMADKSLISNKIQLCIEQICSEGCQSVRIYIERLEQGETISHTEELSKEERQQVLAELRSIMAVYDKQT